MFYFVKWATSHVHNLDRHLGYSVIDIKPSDKGKNTVLYMCYFTYIYYL